MSSVKNGRAAVSAALCLLLLAVDCAAAVLNVSPVRISIQHADRSAVVTLRNDGTDEASVQADIRRWAQDEDGADVLEATEDLLVVPRIFTIPAGQSQVVRIGKLVQASDQIESTYRLIFTELAPAENGEARTGVRVRLRLSLPVFLVPEGGARAAVSVVRAQHDEDQLDVVVTNTGNATAQILGFRLGTSAGVEEPDQERAVGGYLLPGSTRRFTVPVDAGVDVESVTAITNKAGAVQYVLPGDK